MNSNIDKTKDISDLGEFGLINHLTQGFNITHSSTIKGIGDDAAVLNFKNKSIVVTTDLLTEGIHFDLVYTPLKHLGYKAVVVNLSDVYAMNATPTQITVSIAVSKKFTLEALDALYDGIKLACEKYNVDLIGGDTTSSLTGLTISVTAIGTLNNDEAVLRSGTKENDLICVSGNLGGAYMGLQLLKREKIVFEETGNSQPDFSGYDYILERQLKPEAQKELIEWLNANQVQPTSMIDISDGLSSELLHICKNSAVGCRLYQEKIPIDQETYKATEEFGLEPTICALNGGEDYELLFTVDMKDYEKIKDFHGISIIGHICEKNDGCYMLTKSDSLIELKAQGWNALNE